MKKIVSIIVALLLMCCAIASVSAEVSPEASIGREYIQVDAVPVPEEGGSATPGIDNPGKVEVESGENVTLTATPSDGWQFSHWEIAYGDFEFIEGNLTTSTIVIKPTGGSNIRVYAHYVKDGTTPTLPDDTTPGHDPDPDDKSPTTGFGPLYAVTGSAVVMAIAAAVVLKKKANA